MAMTRKRAQAILGVTCIAGGLLLTVFVGFQILGGRWVGMVNEFWKWFLPNVTPLTALLLGGFLAESRSQHDPNEPVNATAFWLSFATCILYIVMLAGTIITASLKDTGDLAATLEDGNWVLGFLQGLVAGVLGFYFTTLNPQKPSTDGDASENTADGQPGNGA
ncbi:MAG TPA: hypothetical protein VF006_13215 [Longimicrobium sp.]